MEPTLRPRMDLERWVAKDRKDPAIREITPKPLSSIVKGVVEWMDDMPTEVHSDYGVPVPPKDELERPTTPPEEWAAAQVPDIPSVTSLPTSGYHAYVERRHRRVNPSSQRLASFRSAYAVPYNPSLPPLPDQRPLPSFGPSIFGTLNSGVQSTGPPPTGLIPPGYYPPQPPGQYPGYGRSMATSHLAYDPPFGGPVPSVGPIGMAPAGTLTQIKYDNLVRRQRLNNNPRPSGERRQVNVPPGDRPFAGPNYPPRQLRMVERHLPANDPPGLANFRIPPPGDDPFYTAPTKSLSDLHPFPHSRPGTTYLDELFGDSSDDE
jgi:hypothetical protein